MQWYSWCCNSEIKSIKLLQIAFWILGPYLANTGPAWTTPKIKFNFFSENNDKEIMTFQELFILYILFCFIYFIFFKYHKFWINYKWFSVLCDNLLTKQPISCWNSCPALTLAKWDVATYLCTASQLGTVLARCSSMMIANNLLLATLLLT